MVDSAHNQPGRPNGPAGFSNEPIAVGDLPRLDQASFTPLDPRYLKVSLLGSGVAALTVLTVTGVAAAMVERPVIPLIIGGVLLFLIALSAALKVVEVRHVAYQVREHDISYRSGVLSQTVQTLPFVRVQHARMNRGAIERQFGLATLAVNSAGPDLLIPGLAVSDAEAIKALVIERAGSLTEEAT